MSVKMMPRHNDAYCGDRDEMIYGHRLNAGREDREGKIRNHRSLSGLPHCGIHASCDAHAYCDLSDGDPRLRPRSPEGAS